MKTREVEGNKVVISKYNQTFIASTKLNTKIDLEKASATIANALYEPDYFPALIYRKAEPKVECIIFESGKVVCTGAKEEDINNALTKLGDQFTKSC
jgi:transcription initiation factor TFIID TATA-box-binding protein